MCTPAPASGHGLLLQAVFSAAASLGPRPPEPALGPAAPAWLAVGGAGLLPHLPVVLSASAASSARALAELAC